ncbi:DNA-binding protein, partial [Candidatus Parcubacteria bacterium]
MNDEVFFDGTKYISANDAATSSDLTRDYIARLCREGKIKGRQIGKNWYVNQESLSSFLLKQSYLKATRRKEVTQERLNEYYRVLQEPIRTASSPLGPTPGHSSKESSATPLPLIQKKFDVHSALARAVIKRSSIVPGGMLHAASSVGAHLTPHALSPVANFLHKVIALTAALLLTIGTYVLVNPDAITMAGEIANRAKLALQNGIKSVEDGSFERIFENAGVQLAAAVENPSFTLGTLVQKAGDLARTFNRTVDSYAYKVAFPDWLVYENLFAERPYGGTVVARITPRTLTETTPTATPPSRGGTVYAGGPTTVINQPVVERIVERVVAVGGISEDSLNARLVALHSDLLNRIYSLSSAQTTVINNTYETLGAVARSDNFDDINIDDSDITNSRISGSSVDATTLTTSGDASVGGNLTVTGSLTVSGAQTLSGAITIPYLNATSTTASTFLNASTTLLSVTNRAYFGGTSTTTIDSIGSITLPSAALLTAPYASSTALTVSGTGYFGTASTTNLTVSSLTATRIPFATTSGAFTDSANLTFASDVLSSPSFLATSSSTLQNFTFQNATGTAATTTSFFATTASSTNLFTSNFSLGSLNGPLHANAGVVSATTSIGVLYGGTGLTIAPSYGQLLLGQSNGTYALTATSSLGLISELQRDWQVTNGYLTPTTTIGILVNASSTIGNGAQAGGLTISGGATTSGNFLVQGNTTLASATSTNFAITSIASGNL